MSMHGTYVSGWKFNWQGAREYSDKMHAAGRPIAAAAGADPGIVSCQTCGEMHWREFEIFLCSRCGATTSLRTEKYFDERFKQHFTREVVTSSEATKPEMVRHKLFDGMRVEYIGTKGRGIDGNEKWFSGRWPAGTIQPGTRGTVRRYQSELWKGDSWRIDFDNRTPRAGYVWGVFGPFLDDTLKLIGVEAP